MQSPKPLYIAAALSLAIGALHYRSGSDLLNDAGLPTRYDSTRDAREDIETATAQAKAAGKKVLVVAGGDWNGWCGRLDRFLKENPDVGAQLDQAFVTVKVGVEQGVPPPEALSAYPPMPGYPHFFVVDENGAVQSQPASELENGDYFDRDKLLLFIHSHPPKTPPETLVAPPVATPTATPTATPIATSTATSIAPPVATSTATAVATPIANP
jgi:hypothetical protein